MLRILLFLNNSIIQIALTKALFCFIVNDMKFPAYGLKYCMVYLIMGIVFMNLSCATVPKLANIKDVDMVDKNSSLDEKVNLKYPVLLIHGAGFRDKTFGFINYWGRVPKYLSKHGIAVYYAGTDAWGSIESNAEIIELFKNFSFQTTTA
jgi:hypothetical protein